MAINSLFLGENRIFWPKMVKNGHFYGRLVGHFWSGQVILAVWQEVFIKFLKKFLRHKKGQKAGSKAGPGNFWKNSDATGIPVWGRVFLKIQGS